MHCVGLRRIYKQKYCVSPLRPLSGVLPEQIHLLRLFTHREVLYRNLTAIKRFNTHLEKEGGVRERLGGNTETGVGVRERGVRQKKE